MGRGRGRGQAPAKEMVDELLEVALVTARSDIELAKRQGEIARRICLKFNIRLPYEKKLLFCRGCKKFIVPGMNSRVRIGQSSARGVVITCLECGHVYRKVIPRNPQSGTA